MRGVGSHGVSNFVRTTSGIAEGVSAIDGVGSSGVSWLGHEPPQIYYMLQENGSFMLQENSSLIIIEG